MKTTRIKVILLLTGLGLTLLSSGCATSRTENGVTIENKRSYNFMNYLPW